jgi:hypothetical protein
MNSNTWLCCYSGGERGKAISEKDSNGLNGNKSRPLTGGSPEMTMNTAVIKKPINHTHQNMGQQHNRTTRDNWTQTTISTQQNPTDREMTGPKLILS